MNMKLVLPLILLSVLSLNQRHGANADSTCPKNCRPYEGKVHCNETTLRCSEGCNVGFYGNNCECTCHCGGGPCVRADGTCMKTSPPKPVPVYPEGCKEGFYGSTCECTCHCGGGPCVRADGTCMETSSPKPVPVSPGHTQDCQTVVYIVIICLLCVFCMAIIAASILIYRVKSKRLFQRSKGQRSDGQEVHPLISCNDQANPNTGPSQPDTDPLQPDTDQRQPDTGPPQPGTEQSQTPKMPQTEKDHLAYDMGVHVLYHSNQPNKPVFLYCVHMKFDYRKVNTSKAHITRDRCLVNEQEKKSKMDQFPERFKTFSGTTSLSPTIHGDVPTYWEVHANFELNKELRSTTLLLCIGFCREMERNDDEWFQTPHGANCYNLNVGMCPTHEQICTKIYQGEKVDPISDIQTDIENKEGQTGDLKYGILVWKGKKVIVYFDLDKMERIASLESIDFERPLWPMFGVFKRSNPYVRMKLVTGRDIDMSKKKKDMILRALSSVKCDQ